MIAWLIEHDPLSRHLHHVWTAQQVTEKGVLVALLWVLAFEAVFQLLWWTVVLPLSRRRRARKRVSPVSRAPEAPGALEALVVPQFGTPVTLLFDPVKHGSFLACASGVKCKRQQFTEGEVFFRIAEATDHHPMVAVCTQDVVIRDGALAGREWTDEQSRVPDSATVYHAPRVGHR